jgi:putative membrane protein
VFEPYCGTAPNPENLPSSWNFDPVLMIVLIGVFSALYLAQPVRRPGLTTTLSIVLFVAFISPLCALSSALFSARAVHHILVGAVAAPIIALLLPTRSTWRLRVPVEVVFLLHTAIYWLWHLPVAYDFALSGTWQYWLMQAGLILAATWLWAIILSETTSVFAALGLVVGTMIQMGFLAAVITFAPYPLFEAHFLTTEAFGLNPREDQQIAGLIMWTIGILPYAITAIWLVSSRMLASRSPLGR